MADITNTPEPCEAGVTLFALKLVNDKYVAEYSGMPKEDNTRHQLNMSLASFKSVLSKVGQQNYDRAIIYDLITSNTKLIANGQSQKISYLETSIVLLQRELEVYQYLYGNEDTTAHNQEQTVAQNQEQTVTQNQEQTVTQNQEQTVTQNQEQAVTQNQEQTVTQNQEHTTSKRQTERQTGTY